MFSVGQNIVHPTHGAGTIVDLLNQELVKGYQRYYVIRFADKRLTVRVPMRRTEELGLRRVMGKAKCEEVLEVLQKLPKALPSNFKERRKVVEQLIHSGRPVKIAEAVRELTWRQELKPLNKADSELYAQARAMLVQEMSLSTGNEQLDVERRIGRALSKSIEAKTHLIEIEDEAEAEQQQ